MELEYIVRPVELRDAAGIHALRTMPGVFENILGYPSERVTSVEHYLAHLNDSAHNFSAVLLRENGGELVIGNIGLVVAKNPRQRHVGALGMMVHPDYQGRGVGMALMRAALDLADNWLQLTRLELEVYTDNTRAISLYQKVGFEIEGTKRAMAMRNGRYADAYTMARLTLS